MKIPVYLPSLSGNEKKYVNECLDSTWISSKGKYNSLFENKFAEFINVKYATTVTNGTLALHLALLSLQIGEGDEVIVPTFTYIASVNAITYTGAKPVFVDSDLDTWQMSPDDIKRKINSKTKAIMAVHLYGHPCDMDSILLLAKSNNLYVIEDCAEAIGSEYKGKRVGGFGDVSAFSFFGNKTITCGEGGMVLTNNKKIYERAVHLKGQGLAENKEYWHDEIGYNYRMTNIAAAIGLAQLEQIDLFIYRKIRIANLYKEYLKDLELEIHSEHGDVKHTYWMVTIRCKNEKIRDALRNFLSIKGVETRPSFYPIHMMPMYYKESFSFPNSEVLGYTGVNLPSYPDLTEDKVKYICECIKEFFSIES